VHTNADNLADLNLRTNRVVWEIPLSLVEVYEDIRVKLIPDGLELVEGLDSAFAADVTLASDIDFDVHEGLVSKVLFRHKDDTGCIGRSVFAHGVREQPEVGAHRIYDR